MLSVSLTPFLSLMKVSSECQSDNEGMVSFSSHYSRHWRILELQSCLIALSGIWCNRRNLCCVTGEPGPHYKAALNAGKVDFDIRPVNLQMVKKLFGLFCGSRFIKKYVQPLGLLSLKYCLKSQKGTQQMEQNTENLDTTSVPIISPLSCLCCHFRHRSNPQIKIYHVVSTALQPKCKMIKSDYHQGLGQ